MLRSPMSLSPAVQSVLDLFQGPLCNVRFADVDAAGLAHLAAEVEAATLEVEAREAALVELRQNLAQRHEALLGLAQQALAYARVYAENNDEQLLEVIGGISLPKAAKARKPGAKASPRDTAAAEASSADGDVDRASGDRADAGAGDRTAEPNAPSPSATDDEAPARATRKGRPRVAQASAS